MILVRGPDLRCPFAEGRSSPDDEIEWDLGRLWLGQEPDFAGKLHRSRSAMRTTLNIDGDALREAVEASGGKTKSAVVNEALRLYARRARVGRLADLRGRAKWEGDVDALRKRDARRGK